MAFEGLLAEWPGGVNATVIVRGLRFVSDFEYEFQLALMNRRLDPEVETLFFMPSAEFSYINSSVIKEVSRLGGDVSGLVPAPVREALAGQVRPLKGTRHRDHADLRLRMPQVRAPLREVPGDHRSADARPVPSARDARSSG